MVLAGHFDEDHGGSTYEEKTKTVQIPIIKKYGNFTSKVFLREMTETLSNFISTALIAFKHYSEQIDN